MRFLYFSIYTLVLVWLAALFAKAIAGTNVRDLITNVGSASAAPAAAAAPSAGGAADAKEGAC